MLASIYRVVKSNICNKFHEANKNVLNVPWCFRWQIKERLEVTFFPSSRAMLVSPVWWGISRPEFIPVTVARLSSLIYFVKSPLANTSCSRKPSSADRTEPEKKRCHFGFSTADFNVTLVPSPRTSLFFSLVLPSSVCLESHAAAEKMLCVHKSTPFFLSSWFFYRIFPKGRTFLPMGAWMGTGSGQFAVATCEWCCKIYTRIFLANVQSQGLVPKLFSDIATTYRKMNEKMARFIKFRKYSVICRIFST